MLRLQYFQSCKNNKILYIYHEISDCQAHIAKDQSVPSCRKSQAADQAEDHAEILVAAEAHDVESLKSWLNAKDLHHDEYENDLDYEPAECWTSLDTQKLGCELLLEA